MTTWWRQPVALVNGRVVADQGEVRSIRLDTRVLSLDQPPDPHDAVIDLDGAFVLPGLINAHDHLELNHFGSLVGRGNYTNASDWIDDVRPRLRDDATIRSNQAYPLRHRLFIGGLKNLLAGVTLVAHHNPFYHELRRAPTRVLMSFGWAHSYALQGHPVGAHGERGPVVPRACGTTPRGVPFFVHAAEGTDARAAGEIERLETDGCLTATTVLVHGVAMSVEAWRKVVTAESSLVWCPASNHAMFGTTAPVRSFLEATPHSWRRICLGSDSRLTGSRDLLDELRAAADFAQVGAEELMRMVTSVAGAILRVAGGGRLSIGGPADLIVVPPLRATAAESLLAAARADIQLVVINGEPQIADPRYAPYFGARRLSTGSVSVDGVGKLATRRLSRTIARCPIPEPGVSAM